MTRERSRERERGTEEGGRVLSKEGSLLSLGWTGWLVSFASAGREKATVVLSSSSFPLSPFFLYLVKKKPSKVWLVEHWQLLDFIFSILSGT